MAASPAAGNSPHGSSVAGSATGAGTRATYFTGVGVASCYRKHRSELVRLEEEARSMLQHMSDPTNDPTATASPPLPIDLPWHFGCRQAWHTRRDILRALCENEARDPETVWGGLSPATQKVLQGLAAAAGGWRVTAAGMQHLRGEEEPAPDGANPVPLRMPLAFSTFSRVTWQLNDLFDCYSKEQMKDLAMSLASKTAFMRACVDDVGRTMEAVRQMHRWQQDLASLASLQASP